MRYVPYFQDTSSEMTLRSVGNGEDGMPSQPTWRSGVCRKLPQWVPCGNLVKNEFCMYLYNISCTHLQNYMIVYINVEDITKFGTKNEETTETFSNIA